MARTYPPVAGGTASGFTVRTGINSVLAALQSSFSGAGVAATPIVGQLNHNTTTDALSFQGNSAQKTLATTEDLLPLATGRLIGYQVFTSSGTYTKATNSPTFVIVEVQGGGGSGAASAAATLLGNGAAGGWSKKKILASALAASETVTVSAGGAAVVKTGTGATTGNNGTTSSFGSLCSATGGAGGYQNSGSDTVIASPPAVGGAGFGGDLNGDGGSGSSYYGTSGASHFSEGVLPKTAGDVNVTGNSGNLGAGGGAAGTTFGDHTRTATSGAGGPGIVIVWEYS